MDPFQLFLFLFGNHSMKMSCGTYKKRVSALSSNMLFCFSNQDSLILYFDCGLSSIFSYLEVHEDPDFIVHLVGDGFELLCPKSR
jgi:hypothetical protein